MLHIYEYHQIYEKLTFSPDFGNLTNSEKGNSTAANF